MYRDHYRTRATLEHERATLSKAPPSALRDEVLRLNAFARALLEVLEVDTMAEAVAIIEKIKKARDNGNN